MNAVITGVGALSPLGLDLESFWTAILEEKDCIKEGVGELSPAQWQAIQDKLPQNRNAGKIAQLSYYVAQEAMRKAGWDKINDDDGIILGTTTGQITHWEQILMQAFREDDLTNFLAAGGIKTPGESLNEFCRLMNFKGKSMMIVSACSASTQALGLAAEWVKSGRVKRCLVGGAEVLTTLSVEGFRCLGLLSRERAKPFDEKRVGINLSEAAAFFCVEKARENESRAVAVIQSFATNSDAYHLTAPHPEGAGTQAIFSEVLERGAIRADQVDWIHAHGTASPTNDKAEGAAIQKIFPQTPVTSTKAYHGHALGAAGALEAAICVQALRQQMKIKSLGLETLDPTLQLQMQREHASGVLNYIVKSSLGFGGVNAALLFAHPRTLVESL